MATLPRRESRCAPRPLRPGCSASSQSWSPAAPTGSCSAATSIHTPKISSGRFAPSGNNVVKISRHGFRGAVEQHLSPEAGWERRVFDVLAEEGLEIDGFNDRSRGTLYYEADDPEVVRKALDYVPPAVVRWMRRKLEPWGGTGSDARRLVRRAGDPTAPSGGRGAAEWKGPAHFGPQPDLV